ncbi:5-formyltetrahydrofolate cyclo-ligase [Erythrobacter sp. YT30]|uniref:5-formyltetrahydrofolate cyclo-ligase n=1 Tax=Erythrobacter sp. YT30 TaxID=1735012 RepID=UPI00076C0011|nr:5-formyltetrahydrofolate cyclo-ligase [Erythrobacter sp. YT30]KWV93436.1 5-formyltetrahydrofolate cyclo-ligase [Erythrobacter sp. YT30]
MTVTKSALRKILRATRKEHAAAQPDAVRALLFNRPPRPLLAHIEGEAIIGLYHATGSEAPTGGYARFFAEEGHRIALPYFATQDAPMAFREHTDPFSQSDLTTGAFDIKQPSKAAAQLTPDIVFVPLIGFTAQGDRLGQGGGHYDRWLVEHPKAMTIGMAWDVQLVEHLPTESHDVTLDAIVTPTRLYGLD